MGSEPADRGLTALQVGQTLDFSGLLIAREYEHLFTIAKHHNIISMQILPTNSTYLQKIKGHV